MKTDLSAITQDRAQDLQVLLLPFSTDVLIPPSESKRLAEELKRHNVRVHFEPLESTQGHDAFLINREVTKMVPWLHAFLDPDVDGIDSAIKLNEMQHTLYY